jgi:hypothetical protein
MQQPRCSSGVAPSTAVQELELEPPRCSSRRPPPCWSCSRRWSRWSWSCSRCRAGAGAAAATSLCRCYSQAVDCCNVLLGAQAETLSQGVASPTASPTPRTLRRRPGRLTDALLAGLRRPRRLSFLHRSDA